MPADLQSIADPRLILLAWAAGLAFVAAAVSLAQIVGPGFSWLTAGVSAMVGLPAVLADDGWWARAALVALILGAIWARNKKVSGALFLVAGAGYLLEAVFLSGLFSGVTATLALGGVTGEMMLGHWYLVDPRLPRPALRNLAVVGIAGLLVEAALQVGLGIEFTGGALGFWVRHRYPWGRPAIPGIQRGDGRHGFVLSGPADHPWRRLRGPGDRRRPGTVQPVIGVIPWN